MNSAYEEVLPYIRPRSGELGWLGLLMAGMLLALLAATVLTYIATIWRSRRRTRLAFSATGLERHLSPSQIHMLYDLSRRHRMHDPLLLLTSLKVFDQHAGRLADETDNQAELRKLASARKRLGFDRPSVAQRFYTTRTLTPGQKLMVWPHGQEAGFIQCVVVGRDERAVTAVPLRRDDDHLLSRVEAGARIKVRFWRDGDTEYRFRTEILEVVEHTTTIRLRHAEELERVQQRDFYRIRINAPIRLYALPVGVEEITPERVAETATKRQDATLIDLSGGGLSTFQEDPVPRHAEVVVDPEYDGPFPLGGAHLLIVDQTQKEEGWHVRLQFADLPAVVRDDLVAAIFDHELVASV
ncbi:MAG TPA: hypothetical protein QGF95_27565 [Candidatus Latescibacteria bacterium]|jgi:c-di-GMP-binding flagellar brake protein YcgR|nr:hypothetical protein [Gemmatimonadaceae bacterium]MDP6016268.1 hypothetical protein [Candidatus Latescibacterota bacterium]HJP34322.1 hypothetical protein [Candidatus Latescibacterota bacterium]